MFEIDIEKEIKKADRNIQTPADWQERVWAKIRQKQPRWKRMVKWLGRVTNTPIPNLSMQVLSAVWLGGLAALIYLFLR